MWFSSRSVSLITVGNFNLNLLKMSEILQVAASKNM